MMNYTVYSEDHSDEGTAIHRAPPQTTSSTPSFYSEAQSFKSRITRPIFIVLGALLSVIWLILCIEELSDPSSSGFVIFLVVVALLLLSGIPILVFSLAFSDK